MGGGGVLAIWWAKSATLVGIVWLEIGKAWVCTGAKGAWHPGSFWTVLSGTRGFWQFYYISPLKFEDLLAFQIPNCSAKILGRWGRGNHPFWPPSSNGPDYIVLSKVDYSSINVDPMRSLSFMHQKTTQKLHVNACCCGLGIYGKIYILLHSGLNSAWKILCSAISFVVWKWNQ